MTRPAIGPESIDDTHSTPSIEDTGERVLTTLRQNTAEVVPELDLSLFTPERTLAELGCNSIDRADIVTMTMETLGIVVPVHEFHQGLDIGTLVEIMRKQL
ncbi:phosphopantetheine-binding protein [Streptomyces sp. RKAG293]|uniref:phosphopantetheine-binding protein n=1 Tax=Streptomyces sp. RKAG293 TaxID=2893403 RepID=UPI002034074D|nr:phosphopantetheine-binding protein [Streptomyces sp. RKAG293]MCM2416761.1 phosphopantetheine-binding protein [Streptomyces sp. RKAG293]